MEQQRAQHQEQSVYEPPAMVEVGDFAELTMGTPSGNRVEGGQPGRWWYYMPAS
ncbi:lasso RiPP family leader peptide-containing protein [Streptomyces sp. SCA3-4]|uniref:lasso RiPP family leader peptide-containing protein n=1 Tax=Streptomyces sichuanensis TaxID=2871810 RepID=UPI001CE3393F|nr:lasso RiPP family leader peptide-containing protein [Streptomyces sichuanensis]MCA6091104.1 lasso RiPP family leader peptide-containing protein [Streptomyces sichuanensis]